MNETSQYEPEFFIVSCLVGSMVVINEVSVSQDT